MNSLTQHGIVFRSMEMKDVPAVSAIEEQINPSPWIADMFERSLEVGFLARVLARSEEIVGYGLLSLAADECQVLNIGISLNWQHQGFGTMLLSKLLDEAYKKGARYCYLEVRQSNDVAQKLYRRLGFKEMGFRKQYYITSAGREDAILFSSDLHLLS